MTKIQRLTKESEELISSALSVVADLTNDGETPNDAIVKVASDKGISAGHVRLMVRAFNNGRSLGQLRDHTELQEKAASFTLADASEILERMFPSEVKSASDQAASVAIASDYSRSPTYWLKRRSQVERRPALEKTAADRKTALVDRGPAYPAYPLREGKKTLSKLADFRRENDRLRDAAIGAAYKVASDVNELGEYFRRMDALPAVEVGANVAVTYGAAGAKLVKHAASFQKKIKTAGTTHAVDWGSEPYSLVTAALDAMGDFTEKRAALETFEKELPEKQAEELRPFGLGLENVIVGSVWDSQSLTKEGIGLLGLGLAGASGGMARGMSQRIAPKSKEQLIQEQMNDLASPEHEDKLRSIRMQTMMHEMMASDPIISGYDPQMVMEAFNHLSEVAPRAMQQRVMAQALIRKYLEQASAMDPFDIGQLLEVEGGITERDMPQGLLTHHSPGPMREMGPMQSKPRGLSENAPDTDENQYDTAMKDYTDTKNKPWFGGPKKPDKPDKPPIDNGN